MCKPSCCKPSSEGAGITAVAVLGGVAFVAVKIGPAVARLWHIAVEALTIFTLTCAAAAACILITWATARIIAAKRKPPGLSRPAVPSQVRADWHIASLEEQLTAARARERALTAALAAAHAPRPPATRRVPLIEGQVVSK